MKKILIVDDSPILRSTIRAVLERSGYQISGEAGNSEEAMALFQKEKPDMILLDILLPGESGLDILKKIMGIAPDSKVLIITAINQESVNSEAKSLGAKGILYKPFDPMELINAIDAALTQPAK
ncbi:MAG: response regulator [Elusimicrobia bacterium]|nr:response regulator [Elusimicrobiota bacterium]